MLWNQLGALDLSRLFAREFSFAPDGATWIYGKPKGGKWAWRITEKKRMWRADFACLEAKLLVECDGSTFTGGGHSRGASTENEDLRDAEAVINGWAMIRVTRHMIESGIAIDLIQRALIGRMA